MSRASHIEWHTVAHADRQRIRCTRLDHHLNICDEPAMYCQRLYWDSGQGRGVSFFYFCEAHAREQGQLGPESSPPERNPAQSSSE